MSMHNDDVQMGQGSEPTLVDPSQGRGADDDFLSIDGILEHHCRFGSDYGRQRELFYLNPCLILKL